MRQFPIRISDGIRVSTNRFDLGVMRVGETKERGIVILHRDEGNRQERIPIIFSATNNMATGLQHISYPIKTKEKDKEVTITIALDVIIK